MSDSELNELLSEPESEELWLLSFSDLLTLLVGFFVLLLSLTPMKSSRLEELAEAMTGRTSQASLSALRENVQELVQRAGLQDRVRTRTDANGLGIELKDALLFDSGSATLRPEGQAVVEELAALLAKLPARAVTVEGHSDDVPIHTPAFASNWELSSQRAINVLKALQTGGVAHERLSARSFADTQPAAGEALDARRAASRRVVIRVE